MQCSHNSWLSRNVHNLVRIETEDFTLVGPQGSHAHCTTNVVIWFVGHEHSDPNRLLRCATHLAQFPSYSKGAFESPVPLRQGALGHFDEGTTELRAGSMWMVASTKVNASTLLPCANTLRQPRQL